MEQIFVIAPFSEEEKQKLCAAAPLCRVSFPSPEELESRIGEADMIVGNPPPALLRRAGRLRLLQLESSGANQYAAPGVLPAIRPENYPADTLCRISFAGLPQRADAGHLPAFVGHTAVPISGEGGSIRIRPCSSAFLPACISAPG